MTGYCVSGDHEHCPDTRLDTYVCDCPCHLEQKPTIVVNSGLT